MKIGKLDAAKRQLTEAIHLFFEDRDPVSVHTLAHAAFTIVSDYAIAHKIPVLLHKTSPAITEEGRKIWAKSINKAKNFFKHAEEDLKNNNTEIDFEPDLNMFVILGAIDAFRELYVAKVDTSYVGTVEYQVFSIWMALTKPKFFKGEYVKVVNEQAIKAALSVDKSIAADLIALWKKSPSHPIFSSLKQAEVAA